MEYVRAGCATLIALVFLASAVAKLRDLPGFRRSLPALAPVGAGLVRPLAMLVVALEAATPILLVTPPATSYGFALACALLIAFSAAIAVALRRGRQAPCRCFGASSTPIGPRHLVRNATLLGIAGLGWLAPERLFPPAGGAVAVAAGLFGAILIVSFDDIADLFARSS
ncbi:MauE/DoxX family redox-associated membrane protein [Sphaerisporangium corydalis]|uniref:MauE/DoxX family redox-associated membrane protein n=1 Tax=Sphaerisporangium corydalis TaxID=1441875 RepID=A0ABV9EIA3_9ACTN|nr:MauE/DoxX family redox-associated membrane protein [Sphaerisporangium corydalis]